MKSNIEAIVVKNITIILFSLLMILFIIGCASSPKKETSTTAEEEKKKEKPDLSSLFSKDVINSFLNIYKKKKEDDKIPAFFIDPGYHLGGINDVLYCERTREIITSGRDNTLRFWDVESGRERKKFLLNNNVENDQGDYFLALSQDQKYIAVCSNSGSKEKGFIRILDSKTGAAVCKSINLELDIISLAFSTDNTLLIANAKDNTIKYLKYSEKYHIVRTLQLDVASLSAVAFINKENDIYVVAAGKENGIKIFSLANKEMIQAVNLDSPVQALAVHRDYIAAGLENQTIVVLDHNLTRVAVIVQNYFPEIFTFTPDNKYLLTVSPMDKQVLLFDTEKNFTPEIIETDFINGHVKGTFINNTTMILTGKTAHHLYSLDITTGNITQRGTNHDWGFDHAIIMDQALVLTGTADIPSMELSLEDCAYKPSDREFDARRLSLTAGDYSIIQEMADKKTGNSGSIEVKNKETSSSLSIEWDNAGFFGFMGEEYILIEYPVGIVKVYNTSLTYLCTLNGISTPLQDLTFSSNYIALLDKNNLITLWRIQDISGAKGEISPHLTFFTDKDQKWVLYARNGFYTCGNKGDRWLWLSKEEAENENTRLYSAALFSSLYHRDDFLLSLASGMSYSEAEALAEMSMPLKQVSGIFPNEAYYLSNTMNTWTEMDLTKTKKITDTTTYIHDDMKTFALIGEEPTENSFLFTGLEDYMERIVITNYKKVLNPCTIVEKKAYDIDGKSGMYAAFKGKAIGIEFMYYVWLYHQNNHIYKLIGWRMDQKEEYRGIPVEMEEFLKSFYTFTPGILERDINKSILTYTGPGYEVDYGAAGFEPWTDIQDYYYLAETGAYGGSGTAFYITPVYLGTTNLSTESLTWAYLSAMGIEYSNADLKEFQRIKIDGFSGVEFCYTGDINYYIRILKSDYYAYFIQTMVKDKNNIDQDMFENLYSSISFTPGYGKEKEEQLLSADIKSSVKINSADIMNKNGLYYYNNNQFAKARTCFQAAFESDSTCPTYLENYLYVCSYLNKYDEGLNFIETYISNFPDNFTLISYLAFFQKQTGLGDKAVATYASLFSQGYRDDYDFVDYVTLLWERGEQEKALSEIEIYQGETVSSYVARKEADFYAQIGEYDKGIALLTDIYTTTVFDEALVLDLCSILKNGGRYQEAIEICEEVIHDGHVSANLYFVMGKNQLGLNWYKEAKLSFEKAHELNPGDTTIQEYLDYVSGLLGEKDNTSVKIEITAVPVPEEYFQIIDPSVTDNFKDNDSYYQHRITAISYEKAKEMRITMYYKITVLSYAGISYYSNFTIPFDPGTEALFVNDMKVFDEKGELVATGDVANYYVMDDTSSGLATNNKVLNVPISGLQPGYTFSIVTTKKLFIYDSGPVYYNDYLARYSPIINNYFIVTGDVDDIVYKTRNMAKPGKKDGSLIWHVPEIFVMANEPYTEASYNYIPTIYLGGAQKTWKEEALLYIDEIKEKLTPSAEVISLSRKLTDEIPHIEEKVRTLLKYVQENYTYQGIGFGIRGRIPNSGETIIHNKYGDCKDQALLLYLLLKAVNIPSNLALCNSGMMIEQQVPDLDQFNHMIVYIPDYGNGLFCDPTDKYYDITRLSPDVLRGMFCLILDPENPRMATIPEDSGVSSTFESRRIIIIENSGTIQVQEVLRFKKYAAAYMRLNLSQEDVAQRQISIQGLMSGSIPGIKLNSLEIQHLQDTSADLVLTMEYTAKSVFKKIEGRFIGELPAVWERFYIYLQHIRERKSPIHVYFPFEFKSEIHLVVPGDYKFLKERGPEEDTNLFTAWSVNRDYKGNELIVNFDFGLKGGSYERDSYESFEHALNSAVEELEQAIVLVQ
ncbi:MAG: DUF3857 domain-containing protein [Spirochaetales bacterium]|nr:DUF3857 domain-containing protein [Spirochaetales bacterium]